MVELHFHFPIRLHGVVLNYLSTRTILLLQETVFWDLAPFIFG
jgi:hypothetical protein